MIAHIVIFLRCLTHIEKYFRAFLKGDSALTYIKVCPQLCFHEVEVTYEISGYWKFNVPAIKYFR